MANVLKEAFVAPMETAKVASTRESCILVVADWSCFGKLLVEMDEVWNKRKCKMERPTLLYLVLICPQYALI